MEVMENAVVIKPRYTEAQREAWIDRESVEWFEVGSYYKLEREVRGIPRATIAARLGISATRLGKFENGEPVREAKLIEHAYKLALGDYDKLNVIKVLKDENKRLRDAISALPKS